MGKQLAEGGDVAVHRGWLDLFLPFRDVAVEVLAVEFLQGMFPSMALRLLNESA